MEKIKITTKVREEEIVFPAKLGFGNYFTDHLFEMDYTPELGWHNATIKPLDNMYVHPAAMFIHYGQVIFEGLKAFKAGGDDIVLFRPDMHFKRMNNSAKRICMPEFDIDFALEALKELINVERKWMPKAREEALYVRPFMFASDNALGVRPSVNYKFVMIVSPVGAYYPEGFKPVRILLQDDYVRAVRKGLGECKTSANYAASLFGAEVAHKLGYTQVLWLDAVELKYLEEVGTMNIFVRFSDEVVTPQLTGGILPGVTRASVLQLLKDKGIPGGERRISVDELIERYDKGEVLEVFGTGTAAVISSVGELKFKDKVMTFNNGKIGPLAQELYDDLTKIQRLEVSDAHNWLVKVEEQVVA